MIKEYDLVISEKKNKTTLLRNIKAGVLIMFCLWQFLLPGYRGSNEFAEEFKKEDTQTHTESKTEAIESNG